MSKKIGLYISFVVLVFVSNICAAQGRFADANLADFAARKAETIGNIFSDTSISKIVHPAGTTFYITAVHPASAWTLSSFSGKVATASTCTGTLAGATDPGISIITYGDRKDYYVACFYLAGDTYQYFVYGFKFSLANSTPTCNSPQILQNGQCVTPTPTCYSPQILQNGQCVTPTPTCYSPQVLQNGQCVTPTPTCYSPQILQNGQCVTPTPTCNSPQVLQNGQCVTPTPPSTSSSATYSNGTLVIKGLAVDSTLGRNYYDVTMTLKALSNPLTFTVDSAVPSK